MAARAQALGPTEMASSTDTRTILQAIGGVRESIAGLGENVKNLGSQVQELRDRVGKIDDSKAARGDLVALEARTEKTINEVKADAAFQAGRLSQEWTQRLDMIVEEVEELRVDVKEQGADLKELNSVRYKIVGACLLLGTVSGAFFAWLFHLIR